jgi:pimeloyl-ACP methyl ester carboxylesterase
VLVHGAVADHTRWASVEGPLAERFTLLAMDRRGRGGSGDQAEYAIQREFEDVAALVGAIGEPVNLLGHSFGAYCCLEAALLTPHIERLILYQPPAPGVKGTLPPEVGTRIQRLLDAGDRERVISTFLVEVAGITTDELAMLRSAPSWPGRAAAHTILREIHELEGLPPFDPARFQALKTPTFRACARLSGAAGSETNSLQVMA